MIDVNTWIAVGLGTVMIAILLIQVGVGIAIPFRRRGILFLDDWRDLVIWKNEDPSPFWLTIVGQAVLMFILWCFVWIMG